MSDGLRRMIELITSWIVKAFLGFVPNWDPLKSGQAKTGTKAQAFASAFFPNLRKILSFSSLTTDYRLLTTASSPLSRKTPTFVTIQRGFVPIQRGFGITQTSFGPTQTLFAPTRAGFAPVSAGFCPSLGRVLSLSHERVSSCSWQMSGKRERKNPQISQIPQILSFLSLKPNA